MMNKLKLTVVMFWVGWLIIAISSLAILVVP
jgi:hypothetical protein